MAVYFVTGKLGSGKTLACVGRIRDYLREGRRVATNLDLDLGDMLGDNSLTSAVRLPDQPRLQDMELLGYGGPGTDEKTFGGIFLDELGTWFNARTWNNKERLPLMDWFLHARHYRWDVYFIMQDIDQVDRQLRDSLCEHLVICRRLDRMPIPGLRWLASMSGGAITLPKVHVASVYYGSTSRAILVQRWWYRAQDLYGAYDTEQVFRVDQLFTLKGAVDMRATYTMLPPYYTSGHQWVDLACGKQTRRPKRGAQLGGSGKERSLSHRNQVRLKPLLAPY